MAQWQRNGSDDGRCDDDGTVTDGAMMVTRQRQRQRQWKVLATGAAKACAGSAAAKAMDGATATDGATASQRQQQWTAGWHNGDRRRNSDATVATESATTMEGAMAMGGGIVTAMVTVAMDDAMATATIKNVTAMMMEGTTAVRQRCWQWTMRRQRAARKKKRPGKGAHQCST